MIVKREKYFIKKVRVGLYYGEQKVRRTSYWLLGIVPLYIKNRNTRRKWEK